jgi:EF-hand domain pair
MYFRFTLLSVAAATAAIAANPNAAMMLDRMGGADANRDGSVTKSELIAFRASNFSRLDRDGNGVLTKSDIPAMMARLNRNLDINSLIDQFDANGDKKVSRDEFVNGPTVIFDHADTNKDNVLTATERKAAMAKARG